MGEITHQFDAGAAWENLALEASSRGLAVHGMQGFDYEKARNDLEIPDNFDVMAMISIGQPKYLCNAIEEANDNSAHFPSLQFIRC